MIRIIAGIVLRWLNQNTAMSADLFDMPAGFRSLESRAIVRFLHRGMGPPQTRNVFRRHQRLGPPQAI